MLYKIKKKDIAKASDVLTDAFQDDPLWKSFFAGESDVDLKMRACFETPVRYCYKYGEVYATSKEIEGVAAWVPGHHSYMSIWKMILSGAIFSGMRMGVAAGRKMSTVFGPLEDDRRENMGAASFNYLFIIGVRSDRQGQGFGSLLLRGLIDACRVSGDCIYLETETQQNVSFYEGYGFEVVRQIVLPVVNHPMWQMVWRPDTAR